MNYQRRIVSVGVDVGEPGPLPLELVGLPDEVLADLSAHLDAQACAELGYTDAGFVPVTAEPPEPALPATVPMYKVKKFLAKTRLEGGPDLHAAIITHLESLAEPARTLAMIDFGATETTIGSPNFVVGSPLVQNAKAALGLTDEQFAAMVLAANAIA